MTRRIFAIAAVLAVATAATALAQASVAGTIETRMNLFRVNVSEDDPEPTMGGLVGTAWLQLSGANADGTLGATWRLRNQDLLRADDGVWHLAFAWWRPVQQFRMLLGVHPDGMFDTTSLAGWDFHQGDNDYMFNHHWDFWRRIFPGNWDAFGLALSLMEPVDGLNVNLILPTGDRAWPRHGTAHITATRNWEELLAGFRLHATYALPGLGLLQFTYNAPGAFQNDPAFTVARTTWEDAISFGQLGLSFLMTSLDFGNLLFGGAMVIPDDADNRGLDLHLGAAVHVPASTLGDVMGLRFRVGAQVLNGAVTVVPGGDDFRANGLLTANVMPILGLAGGQLMVDLGLTMALVDGNNPVGFDAESHLGWSVKPVFRLPMASGSFAVGMHLWSNQTMGGNIGFADPANNDVHINFPMRLTFSF